MTAHRARRTAGAALLALVASLLVLAPPSPADALTQTTTISLDGTTTQDGRINRDGVASTCGSAKAYPGILNVGTTYNYATYEYVAPSTGCLTIERSNVTCSSATNIHLSVYEKAYLPGLQEAHYLGDQGSSDDASVIGVDVEKGHTYVVVATNTSVQEPCTVDVTFHPADDTTPPDTVLVKTPGAKVRDSSALLTFKGTPADDTVGFECRLDGAPFGACESPLVLEDLSVGSHTVDVRAVDFFGNVDPTPATATFLSCDAAAASVALDQAANALFKAQTSLTKAKSKLAKAKKSHKPAKAKKKQLKKAKKSLKKASKKAKKAKKALAAIRTGALECAS